MERRILLFSGIQYQDLSFANRYQAHPVVLDDKSFGALKEALLLAPECPSLMASVGTRENGATLASLLTPPADEENNPTWIDTDLRKPAYLHVLPWSGKLLIEPAPKLDLIAVVGVGVDPAVKVLFEISRKKTMILIDVSEHEMHPGRDRLATGVGWMRLIGLHIRPDGHVKASVGYPVGNDEWFGGVVVFAQQGEVGAAIVPKSAMESLLGKRKDPARDGSG